MDEYKSPEDKIREAVKKGAGRFGLCDACIHRIGYVCEFRPFRDLTNVPKIVSCPALKCIDETMLKKYTNAKEKEDRFAKEELDKLFDEVK